MAPAVVSGSRFVLYCMLHPGSTPPTSVVVSAATPDGPLAVEIAVTPDSVLADGDVLHTLAARALIQDIDVRILWFFSLLDNLTASLARGFFRCV